MAEINLSLAYSEIFGERTTAFEPRVNQLPAKRTTGRTGAAYYGIDSNGREYYMPVTINFITSESAQPNDFGITSSTSDVSVSYELPYPVVSISSRKRIIETPLTNRTGTVKEYINTEGYEIRIRGFLIGNGGQFPEDEIAEMVRMYEVNRAVQISNVLTDLFLDRPGRGANAVITSFRIPENTGVRGVRAYELLLINDEPFNLIDVS